MYRAIIIPQRRKLQFTIPENYIGREIEVFAFPIDSETFKGQSENKSFSAISVSTKGYLFNREDANER
jgi:hypothetical protein